jgi:hypothetical protein
LKATVTAGAGMLLPTNPAKATVQKPLIVENTSVENTKQMDGDIFLIYCRCREGWYPRAEQNFRMWCTYHHRNNNTYVGRECSACLVAATELVGDDFYHPVTGLSFPTKNPYEFIIQITQDPSAKYASYTADGLGNPLPNIKVDRYLWSTYFKNEMKQKGIDALYVVGTWGEQNKWYEPVHHVIGDDLHNGAAETNVFEYFQTPCLCAEETGYPHLYCDRDNMTHYSRNKYTRTMTIRKIV